MTVNFGKPQLCVARNEWQAHISTTNGNRLRHVPITARLFEALRAHRHLRSQLVLYRPGGEAMTESALKETVFRAVRGATVRNKGPHILCHTFCSHLATKGAPARPFRSWPVIAISPRPNARCT